MTSAMPAGANGASSNSGRNSFSTNRSESPISTEEVTYLVMWRPAGMELPRPPIPGLKVGPPTSSNRRREGWRVGCASGGRSSGAVNCAPLRQSVARLLAEVAFNWKWRCVCGFFLAPRARTKIQARDEESSASRAIQGTATAHDAGARHTAP